MPASSIFSRLIAASVLLAAVAVPLLAETPAPAPANETTARVKVIKPLEPIPPSDEEVKKTLTPEQFAVTRRNATEAPFTNAYWKTMDEGIYVDVISGKPLFSSRDKFESDCGWPAFAKPISDDEIKELSDTTHEMERIEVRSKSGGAHLGHVFNDGPKEKGGIRYCINSASIRFIPKDKMEAAGYGAWLKTLAPESAAKPAQEAKKGK